MLQRASLSYLSAHLGSRIIPTGRTFKVLPAFTKPKILPTSTFVARSRAFAAEPFAESDKNDILKLLANIEDPDLHRDIVSLGFVKNMSIDKTLGTVAFDLELTTPACPVKDQFVEACETILKHNLDWVKVVKVKLTAQERKKSAAAQKEGPNGLEKVKSIVAVSSCKGGVGKSSVATNLAFMLSKIPNVKVGIFDADVYGPSLPFLVPTAEKAPFDPSLEKQIQPFMHNNVKLMSMGFLRPGESVALRGPMVSGMVQQMLTMTGWGDLDYLIIDMPPGTGDIQLTVGQHAKVDAAVIVTTPQQLSLVDVEKGIQLNDKLKIPAVAVVENMSYFVCEGCEKKKKHYIFGDPADGPAMARKFGIENYIKLPIDPQFALSPASKKAPSYPFVNLPDIEHSLLYSELKSLTDHVVRAVAKVKFDDAAFKLQGEKSEVLDIEETRPSTGEVLFKAALPARALRLACKSATMIDEWTGEKLFREEDIPMDVTAKSISTAGRYAMRVEWTDGHSSIYPIQAIKDLVASLEEATGNTGNMAASIPQQQQQTTSVPREARI